MSQSNKRYFNTFFFEDPYIEDLDHYTRFLYLAMILNPHNNLAGVYEVSIKKLIGYTGLPEDKVRLGIQKLQEDRKILFSGNWLALKNFIKNNELNPNMCKNAFDIMRAAPKEKIIFIISDQAGNAEPWLDEFIIKIEKGINAAIDSKNRNAIKYAQEKKLPEPTSEQHQVFTLEQFRDSILNNSKHKIRGTLPPTLPPSIPFQGGEPSGEYKGEIEYEIEVEEEIEREIEIGNHEPRIFQGFQPATTPNIDTLINHWNDKGNLPHCRFLSPNLTLTDEHKQVITHYTHDEIIKAIDNYSEVLKKDPDSFPMKYKEFKSFISKGVVKFCDEALKTSTEPESNTVNEAFERLKAKGEYE